jgi:hypothetical protein
MGPMENIQVPLASRSASHGYSVPECEPARRCAASRNPSSLSSTRSSRDQLGRSTGRSREYKERLVFNGHVARGDGLAFGNRSPTRVAQNKTGEDQSSKVFAG